VGYRKPKQAAHFRGVNEDGSSPKEPLAAKIMKVVGL